MIVRNNPSNQSGFLKIVFSRIIVFSLFSAGNFWIAFFSNAKPKLYKEKDANPDKIERENNNLLIVKKKIKDYIGFTLRRNENKNI